MLKLGTHNSLSYHLPQWWMIPFMWMARCQRLNIEEQYVLGVRYFDIRPKLVGGRVVAGHGLATYKLDMDKVWFGTTMWLTAGLLMPAILEVTPGCYQFTAFLASLGMMLIGIAPNFREGIDRPIHITGAILCILFSQLWVSLTCPWMLLVWTVYLAYTVWAMKKLWKGNVISAFLLTKPMFWIEVTALITTYISIILT